jgi:branched-subunit amino acid aminotransferase/4-amino-4-deoxychorismate lyase
MPEPGGHIIWNGKIIGRDELVPATGSDWLRYAPGFFETIKVRRGVVYFWEEHYSRMQRGAAWWNIQLPAADELAGAIGALIRSAPAGSGKLRLQCVVNSGNGSVDYLAELEAVPSVEEGYRLNEKGWEIGVFRDRCLTAGDEVAWKSSSRDIYLLARKWMKTQQLDEAIVTNQSGMLADGTFTNLFWLKDGTWCTPPLHAACVPGIMRGHLLGILADRGFSVAESDARPESLAGADEIILTNVIRGVRWVSGLHLDGAMYKMENRSAAEVAAELSKWERRQYG